MKVALACPYDWDAPGGVQVHVLQLARHLRARGHETTVITPARASSGEANVTVVGRSVSVPYQGSVAPICFSPGSFGRIGAALRAFRPDVLHAHEPLVPSTSMLATMRSDAPVVATFHAHAERSALLSLAAPALRPVWRRLRVRLAVSNAAAQFVRSRFGGGIRVVPNGCDVDSFARARPATGLPPGRRLLWVGRLDPRKGFPVALQAFRLLAEDDPDLWLVVAGDGRDRETVLGLPADARRRVVMLGAVPHDELPRYHAAADLFVGPALGQESFGIVLVEAMAAGLPVVASDIPGYREVVRHDREGLLVPPGDASALAAAARRVLDDKDLAHRLAEAGTARADRYRWDVVATEIESAYGEATGRPPA